MFPTDILDKGDFDALVSVGHQSQSRDVVSNSDPGDQLSRLTREELQVRYGLGNSWQIGMDLPYDSEHYTKTNYVRPVANFSNNSDQGSQNPDFFAKYGFLQNAASPWSLALNLSISPDITDKTSTKYEGELSAGFKSSNTLKYYAKLIASVSTSQIDADTAGVVLGAYKEVSENVTLIPQIALHELQSTTTYSSYSQVDIGISSHIQLANTTYLIPSASYFSNSSGENKSGSFRASSSDGRAFNIGLYHLF